MNLKWKNLLVFFVLFAVFGYYREKFFVALNHLMFIKYYGHAVDAPLDAFILFLDGFEYSALYYLKYPFTLLSIIVFALLSAFSIKFILNDKNIIKSFISFYH